MQKNIKLVFFFTFLFFCGCDKIIRLIPICNASSLSSPRRLSNKQKLMELNDSKALLIPSDLARAKNILPFPFIYLFIYLIKVRCITKMIWTPAVPASLAALYSSYKSQLITCNIMLTS